MSSNIYQLLFMFAVSLTGYISSVRSIIPTDQNMQNTSVEIISLEAKTKLALSIDGGKIETQTKISFQVDEGTWQIDELGKQILDETLDVKEEQTYFCPCTIYQNDTLSMKESVIPNALKPSQPNTILTKINRNQTQQIKRRRDSNLKTYRSDGTHMHLEEFQTTYKERKFIDSTKKQLDTTKTSCAAINNFNHIGNVTSVQIIMLPDMSPFKVRCYPDVNLECSWTMILERKSKSDNFDRNWQQYREGFGNPEMGEAFFVGLENLHALTQYEEQELFFFTRFEQENLERERYEYFSIGPESTGYKVLDLHVTSNVTMVRRLLRDSIFSTKDKHVGRGYSKCAIRLGMGWWYSASCKQSSLLNSVRAYVKSPTVMAVRPRDCIVPGTLH